MNPSTVSGSQHWQATRRTKETLLTIKHEFHSTHAKMKSYLGLFINLDPRRSLSIIVVLLKERSVSLHGLEGTLNSFTRRLNLVARVQSGSIHMRHNGLEPFLGIKRREGCVVMEEFGHVESDRVVHALAEGRASANWEPAIKGKIGRLGTVEAVIKPLVVGCFV
jgi:hypothetical protein